MTDYTDIKRRLRELDTCDERGSFTPCPVGQAGADAIEALEKERDRYHDALVARHGGEPIALLSELDEARARVTELEKEAERTFPLQCDRHGTGPTRIPWSVAEEAYGAYARRYGREQSLERISQRGGFGWSEMDQLLPDWRARVSEIERLRARVAELEKERNSYIERWVERAAFAEARVAELETVLRAWHSQFGTTQLTHALARLEAAERKAARVAELELESKRDKAHIEALAAEVDAWRDKPMAQELRDLHEKMAVMRARVSELEKSHHG